MNLRSNAFNFSIKIETTTQKVGEREKESLSNKVNKKIDDGNVCALRCRTSDKMCLNLHK